MRLRAPVFDDAAAVLAVLIARDVADLGVPDVTLEDLIDEWSGSDLDLAADVRVADAGDGRIVGYVVVRRPGTLAVVHPDHERQGIGTRLLEWAEAHDRERGRKLYRQWTAASNDSARTLLTGAGYSVARSYWRMACSLGGGRLAVPAPAGYELRAVDVARDVVALHAVDAASFGGRPDYVAETLREFREEHLDAHDFVAALSRVAERDGAIVGFLLARRFVEDAVGYVDILAVDPRHQGVGVGTALLASAFGAFAGVGLREAQLGVASDNPLALRVYERAGMTVRFRFDIYERPVP
jgi:mycothiol synthase